MLAEGAGYTAGMIEHVHTISERVGDVDFLLFSVDGNSGWAFEEAFPTFEGAEYSTIFAIRLEEEDLAGLGVRHIDVVVAIYRDALRLDHGIFVLFLAIEKFVFVLLGIKNVNAAGTGIGHDHSATRVDGNTVRTDETSILRIAGKDVDHLCPEAGLVLDVALGEEG